MPHFPEIVKNVTFITSLRKKALKDDEDAGGLQNCIHEMGKVRGGSFKEKRLQGEDLLQIGKVTTRTGPGCQI